MNDKLKATLSVFDTDLFEKKIGSLRATGVVPVRMVRETNPEFDAVFVHTTGWQEPKSGNPVALDWRFDMELVNGTPKHMGEPIVHALSAPLASHLDIASGAFADSRFLRDPMLMTKTPELYRRWLMRAQALWALDGPQSEDAFLVQTSDEDGYCRISLIGVGEKYRGMGIGDRLVLGTMARIPEAKGWRVTVAARNWRAIRFYEGLGFRVKDVSTVFHVWI